MNSHDRGMVSTAEAARRKRVSRGTIISALNRGLIDGQRLGPRVIVVAINDRFVAWRPSLLHQRNALKRRILSS